MSETIRELGEAVTFALSVIDRDTPANNPVTGEAPTIAIRRLSDDYWYDFVAGTWGAVVGVCGIGCRQHCGHDGQG